jgi:hypothetical protein
MLWWSRPPEHTKHNFNLPCDVLREQYLECFLGLHYIAVGLLFEGLLIFVTTAAGVGGIVWFLTDMRYGKDPYCCYPVSLPTDKFGSCFDADSLIQDLPPEERIDCGWISVAWMAGMAVSGIVLLAGQTLNSILDLEYAAHSKQMAETPPQEWTRWYSFQWIVLYLPTSILFGTHNRILKAGGARLVHGICGFLLIGFAAFFATAAIELDKEWGCYHMPTATNTFLGMCTDPKSPMHSVKRDWYTRETSFLVTLGGCVVFFVIVCILYYTSTRNIKQRLFVRLALYQEQSRLGEIQSKKRE